MEEFVNHHVFNAGEGLFDQFQIEPYSPGVLVAGAPAGFHSLNAPRSDLHSDFILPVRQQFSRYASQLFPIPVRQHFLAPREGRIVPNLQDDLILTLQANA